MRYYTFILKNGEFVQKWDEKYKALELEHQKARRAVAKELRQELQKTQFDNEDWEEYNKRLLAAIDFKRTNVYYWVDIIKYEDHNSIIYYRLIKAGNKDNFTDRLDRKAVGKVDFNQIDKYKKIEKELAGLNKDPRERLEKLKDFGFTIESISLKNVMYYPLIDFFVDNQ